MNFQKTIIAGNLGRDPEMRYTPAGKAVTNFSVAVNRQYTGSDGQLVKETTWYRIETWGKQAELCNQYLNKGNQVIVEGRLKPDPQTGGPRIYTCKDGSTGADFELVAIDVRFGAKANDNGDSRPAKKERPVHVQRDAAPAKKTTGDKIPF